MIILATTFFLGEILDRVSPVFLITLIGSVWLGILSVAITVFVLKDIVWLFYKNGKVLTYISLLVIFVLTLISLVNVYTGPVVKEIKLKVNTKTFNKKNFTIVQLSDLHLGTLMSENWLEKIVKITNSIDADIVVITGDLADGNIFDKKQILNKLRSLKSKFGVYIVPGNHEFYFGIEKFLEITKILGFKVLRNQSVVIDNDIIVAGVDEITAKRFNKGYGPDLGATFKDVDLNKFIILLSHQPDLFDEARKFGVDLQLSGHTHMGQIPPMDLIVKIFFKYPFGLIKKDNSYIYTTSGTGTWGPPMRLFTKSEIVKIVLEPK
jgi:predicted MPP superfamily phosphohydrolase